MRLYAQPDISRGQERGCPKRGHRQSGLIRRIANIAVMLDAISAQRFSPRVQDTLWMAV